MVEDNSKEGLVIQSDSKREGSGLRLVAYKDGNLCAVYSYTEVTKPEGEEEVYKLIRQKREVGIPTFLGSLTVEKNYSGQGIGLKMLLDAQRLLLSKHPHVLELVIDDSVSPSSKVQIGWTKRHLPSKITSAASDGYRSDILFQGEADTKPTWLIEYSNRENN